MKNIKTYIIYVLFAIATAFQVYAQNPEVQEKVYTVAEEAYQDGKYPEAIKLFERDLKSGSDPVSMRKLADSYLKMRDFRNALVWYQKVCESEIANQYDHLALAKTYKMNGRYDDAKAQVAKYLMAGGNAETGGQIKASCDFAKEGMTDETGFTVKETDFNTAESEFAPVIYGKGLVFTSNREHGGMVTWTDEKSGALFHDLYYVDMTKFPQEVSPLKGAINTNLNDASATFSLDQNVTYFTRNRTISQKELRKNKAVGTLNIFEAKFDGKKWKGTRKLKFNSDDYSTGHPTISEDGKMLFFVSDAEGGMGGSDIYVSYKKGDNWGKPQNLGPEINTPEDELFPMFFRDDVLFFATEGHLGFGGLDIFYVTYVDGKWGKVKNPGYPLNSPADDFGIAIDPLGSTGYFSSNREGGTGKDDIYHFKSRPKIIGNVVDATTDEPLESVKVIIDDGSGKTKVLSSDKEGDFSTFINKKIAVMVRTSKEDYEEGKHVIKAMDVGALWEIQVNLKLIPKSLFLVKGFVTDTSTGKVIDGVNVQVMGLEESRQTQTRDGKYDLKLGKVADYYYVSYKKEGYMPVVRKFNATGLNRKVFEADVAMLAGSGYLIDGLVVDQASREPVANVKVMHMLVPDDTLVQMGLTDGNGRIVLVGSTEASSYLITAPNKRYFTDRKDVPQVGNDNVDVVKVELEIAPYELGSIVETVFFDYDKARLKKKAKAKITPFIYFLEDNPETKVELAGHTDSRGSDQYNRRLSERRAKAVKKFIAQKGVNPDRITTIGYGESRLFQNCPDGVDCSEDQHYENRRCEMRVTSFDGNLLPNTGDSASE